ncbi:hypothetical protein ACWDAO_23405 [Streptomyces sp. NPDC001212]|uniref:hypothetical protein n=1 Tax=Streptomyces sp. HYC2 TaxID=2955207 RepID=UPI0024814265|nr:hypothetical protein [Streptomyces sp. HYC2]
MTGEFERRHGFPSGTNGQYLHYEPEEALALVMRAKGARVQEIAAQLRAWSTS